MQVLEEVCELSHINFSGSRISLQYMNEVQGNEPRGEDSEEESEEEEEGDEDDNVAEAEQDIPLANTEEKNENATSSGSIPPEKLSPHLHDLPLEDDLDSHSLSMSPRGRSDDPSDISDISASRPVSRSPPRSRSISPDSLAKMTEALSLQQNVKGIVSSNLAKTRAQKHRKYHSKRSVHKAGRAHGSKAKQDARIKLDTNAGWD